MTDPNRTGDLAVSVGELKGLLLGIQMMMAENNTSLNRRIDDMHNSNTRRLDDLEKSIGQSLTKQAQDLAAVKKTADEAKELAVANSTRVNNQERELQAVKKTADEAEVLSVTNSTRLDSVLGKATKTGIASGAGTAALIEAGMAIAKFAFGGIGPG
ncbi:hypothetical protein [Hydrocarboniphaga effusa]|uniref:hypothetical protein n=1 Tax=Hydrocarboniphaga effusa TaxID=243629 RepID=UPI003BAABE47